MIGQEEDGGDEEGNGGEERRGEKGRWEERLQMRRKDGKKDRVGERLE